MFGVSVAPSGPHGGVVGSGVESATAELVAQVGVVHLREAAQDEFHRNGGDGAARVKHSGVSGQGNAEGGRSRAATPRAKGRPGLSAAVAGLRGQAKLQLFCIFLHGKAAALPQSGQAVQTAAVR